VFPEDPGTVVTVTCLDSDAVNVGSSEVTCTKGTDFTFLVEPSCSIPGLLTTLLILIEYDFFILTNEESWSRFRNKVTLTLQQWMTTRCAVLLFAQMAFAQL